MKEIKGQFDKNWLKEVEGGFQVWGQNYSSHPWKDRYYEPQLVRTITRERGFCLIQEYKKSQLLATSKEALRLHNMNLEETYLATLPPTVGGLTVGRSGALQDDSGNVIIYVPRRAAHENWPIEQLVNWVDDKLTEYIDE